MVTIGLKIVRGTFVPFTLLLFTANGIPAARFPALAPLFAVESPLLGGEQSQDFTKWVLTQGGLLVGLLVVCYMYRTDLKNLIRAKERRTEQEKENNKILTDIVEKNTAAITQMTTVLQYMERTVNDKSGCEYPNRHK